MRYSQAFIPTVKEVPAEAEIPSHQLMIRAGLMRKLASGTYIYLPAGWKTLQKIMAIVREEMNKAGAGDTAAVGSADRTLAKDRARRRLRRNDGQIQRPPRA